MEINFRNPNPSWAPRIHLDYLSVRGTVRCYLYIKKLLRAGMVPARLWEVHAVGMAPTEMLEMRRQMAAAVGKKSATTSSLFTEAFGLKAEEDFSTLATKYWAEGVWIGKWPVGQKEAWMNQALEVQTWRRVRGPADP